ncbi:hypothetical protein JXJ21_15840 [candidate division KSB1 bacterium]|nr:hypothetical protein [candidate division KSB1 bacterium]
MFILNSGIETADSGTLFEFSHFRELIKIFEIAFELVLLDTPSINLRDDTLRIANIVNSAVLLIYTNQSPADSIMSAYQKLSEYKINVLSA